MWLVEDIILGLAYFCCSMLYLLIILATVYLSIQGYRVFMFIWAITAGDDHR